jgi:ATP phosphoribosyltransferase regulatory subunit HisZ
MDVLAITFVTACTALVSAAAGPLVSIAVSSRQVRAALVSTNRERWLETLRDSLAEYVALALSAAMLQEPLHRLPVDALRQNPEVARMVERVAQARSRILLMVNPAKAAHVALCDPIEQAYQLLLHGQGSIERMTVCVDAIIASGRAVLKSEWARVKRGD